MKSKIGAILLTVAMCISVSPYAFATEECKENDLIPNQVYCVMERTDGTEEVVLGQLTSFHEFFNNANDPNIAATYAFDVYRDGETLSIKKANNTKKGTDEKEISQISLTVYYQIDDSESVAKYLLNQVSGSWKILEDGVSVTNGMVRYGCSDGSTVQDDEKNVDNYFVVKTGFDKYIEDAPMSVMGATLFLDYELADGSNFRIQFTNNYINNGIT